MSGVAWVVAALAAVCAALVATVVWLVRKVRWLDEARFRQAMALLRDSRRLAVLGWLAGLNERPTFLDEERPRLRVVGGDE